MAKIISGMVNTKGRRAEGSLFEASTLSENPWAVVVTYKKQFDRVPVAMAEVSGSSAGVTTAVQSSNTSLAIYTDSSEPVSLFFLATDRGLGDS